jgi:ankyrin repeat protein
MKKKFPLHSAAKRGCMRDVRKILRKGNVPIDAVDSDGVTAFACRRKRHIG